MGRDVAYLVLMLGGALALAGCGLADVRSPVPEFMRNKAAEPPSPEAPPEVGRLVRENLDSLFSAASKPHLVRVSPPRREAGVSGWVACVTAELTSITGKPLSQTYRITISGGVIADRRRLETDLVCGSETYEPI